MYRVLGPPRVLGPHRVLRPGSRFFGMPIGDIIYVLKTIKINLLIAEVSRKKKEEEVHKNALNTEID